MVRKLSASIPGPSQFFLSLAFQRLTKVGKWRQFCVTFHLHFRIAFRKKNQPLRPETVCPTFIRNIYILAEGKNKGIELDQFTSPPFLKATYILKI